MIKSNSIFKTKKKSSLKVIFHLSKKTNLLFVCLADRLKSLGKWQEPLNVKEQSKLLKKFLKNPSNKKFGPGSYVLLEVSRHGKVVEKQSSLKVNFYIIQLISRPSCSYISHYITLVALTWRSRKNSTELGLNLQLNS